MKMKPGTPCEVYYPSQKCWVKGHIVEIESDGLIRVCHGTHAVSAYIKHVRVNERKQ